MKLLILAMSTIVHSSGMSRSNAILSFVLVTNATRTVSTSLWDIKHHAQPFSLSGMKMKAKIYETLFKLKGRTFCKTAENLAC